MAEYQDAGDSAKTSRRPQFLAAIDWARKHKADVFLVWKFDRFARNSDDHSACRVQLATMGVRLMSVTEPAEDNPIGRLLQTVLAGMNQFDNEVKGERARMAKQAAARAAASDADSDQNEIEACLLQCVALLQDPVRLWRHAELDLRQELVTLFFGSTLHLAHGEFSRTRASDCVAGTLHMLCEQHNGMAPPAAEHVEITHLIPFTERIAALLERAA